MQKSKLRWQRLPGHRYLKGRAGHTGTLVGKDIYVLGGRNGNEFFNDMWVFDTEAEQWKLLQSKVPFSPRAYHTCTLVNGHELWVIGGSDPRTMHSDVHVFDTVSLKWFSPHIPLMQARGTHAAVLHPTKEKTILIYGGYGGPKSCWLNDLIILHTDTLEWEDLKPEGARPIGRGYHTLTTFGTCVVLFGGKAECGILNEVKLSIYDAVTNRWSMISAKGERPSPRSNHASTLTNCGTVVIHGGRHGSLRLNDLYILQVSLVCPDAENLDLRWHLIESPESLPAAAKRGSRKRSSEAAKSDQPSGRSAHSIVLYDQSLYIFGGYGGEGQTFADMFVLRKLPKPVFPEVEITRKKLTKELLFEVGDSMEERSMDKTNDDYGWRNTKQPNIQPERQSNRLCSPVALNVQDNGLHEPTEAAGFLNQKQAVASETRSTQPLTRHEKNAVSSKDPSLAMLVSEKDLYQKEVRNLQKSVETLQATIDGKSMVDLNYQQKLVNSERDLQKLQNENLQQQLAMKKMEQQGTVQAKKMQKLEQENNILKTNLQNVKLSLDEMETTRRADASKMEDLQNKLQETGRAYEGIKAAATGATEERDGYKSCVQTLETELQRQMDTLRQVTSKFEGEKAFLLQEIAERKHIADISLTELGALKESVRSLEEKNKNQLRQLGQESDKISSLMKEKETLACAKAILESEGKQLVEMRQAAENNCILLRSELQASRISAERFEAEAVGLKERAGQNQQHLSELHESLKLLEEKYKLQLEEHKKICALLHESEEFEQGQLKLMQAHTDKLRCARQSCSFFQ